MEDEKHAEIAHLALNNTKIQVLSDIQQFLYIFHIVQEIVSAEKTPTLSLVLPLYEKLVALLNKLKIQLPKLEHAIEASVEIGGIPGRIMTDKDLCSHNR